MPPTTKRRAALRRTEDDTAEELTVAVARCHERALEQLDALTTAATAAAPGLAGYAEQKAAGIRRELEEAAGFVRSLEREANGIADGLNEALDELRDLEGKT